MSAHLEIRGVGKAYRTYRSDWRRLGRLLGLPFKPQHEHWVLKDIDLQLAPGEALGIIGHNGAGKSTLLKIITGTTQPTTGQVRLHGRIAAILELGMGFDPELTGRQNAYHAAGLMGLQLEHVQQLMPEIEAFAEIGDYFDEPVRTYSSGMQVRVAFSVATAVRPDILIVDEALSVGDAYFQHKSFDRIRAFNQEGTSLLLVSHDSIAIKSICNRAILLKQGQIEAQGRPEDLFDLYNAQLSEHQDQEIVQTAIEEGQRRTDSGTGEARIEDIELCSVEGLPLKVVSVGQPIEIRFKARVFEAIDALVLGFAIKDRLGQVIFATNTYHTNQQLFDLKPGQTYRYTLHCDANLGEGSYSVHASLVRNFSHVEKNYHWIDRGLIFEVVNTSKPEFEGCCWTDMRFSIEST